MNSRGASFALAVAIILAATPRDASATPTFPELVQRHWDLRTTPPCTLCHTNPNGGLGTATTPFAFVLESRGLRANDEVSLERALDADRAERLDANGNGVPDYDELVGGADPNSTSPGAAEFPEYGLACRAARASRGDEPAFTWVAATLMLLARRASRRRPRRSRAGGA